MVLVAAVAVVAAAPTGAALANPSFYPTRDEPAENNWLVGRLTWNEGRGGISWSANPTTEPSGGHRQAAPAGEIAEPDVFVSEPLPRSLHLNASRNIELDLFVRDTGSGGVACIYDGFGRQDSNLFVRIHLYAGPDLIGGAWEGHKVAFPAPVYAPPGYLACVYRMPIELDRLEKGTELTLRFTYYSASSPTNDRGPHEWALGDESPSLLRLSYYSPEDSFFRTVHPNPPGPTPAPEKDPSLLPILPLPVAMVSIGAATKGRRSSALAAALLSSALLGACLAGPEGQGGPESREGLGGTADVAYRPGASDDIAANERGRVIGTVNDAHTGYALANAFVTLLGSPHNALSDTYGRFLLDAVPPGSYVLRVDRAGYRSHESSLDVVAGNVTEVRVRLEGLNPADSDARPHVHDYWKGRTRVEIVNTTLTGSDSWWVGLRDSKEEWPTVLPGTTALEFRFIRASSNPGVLGVTVGANHDPNPNNYSLYLPKSSGEPTRIITNWEMTDPGHQRYSTWRIGFYGEGDVQPATVTLVAIRGPLPLEPAHLDPWGEKTELPLVKDAPYVFSRYGTTTNVVLYSIFPFGFPCHVYSTNGDDSAFKQYLFAMLGPPHAIVPPGTHWVNLTAEFNRPIGAVPGAPYGWDLWFKAGNKPPTRFSTTTGAYAKAPSAEVSNDRHTFSWSVIIAPEESDPVYHRRSAWDLVLMPTDYAAACTDLYANADRPPGLTWSLGVARES